MVTAGPVLAQCTLPAPPPATPPAVIAPAPNPSQGATPQTPPAQTTPAPNMPQNAVPPPAPQNRGSAPNISAVPADKRAAETKPPETLPPTIQQPATPILDTKAGQKPN